MLDHRGVSRPYGQGPRSSPSWRNGAFRAPQGRSLGETAASGRREGADLAKLRVYRSARGERRGSWHSRRVIERRLPAPPAYRFSATVGQLSLGRHDPAARFIDGAYWLATPTPGGPASLRLHREGATLVATGYGPGAEWVVDHAAAIAGLRDRLDGFDALAAAHPVVADLARTYRGVRLPATGQVFPRVLRAVCEQKVTGKEAYRAYAAIVRRLGTPAPGPVDRLWLPPTPEAVAATPYWVFHPLGLEQRRADTLCRVAAVADRLERCADPAEVTPADRSRSAMDRRGGAHGLRRPGRGECGRLPHPNTSPGRPASPQRRHPDVGAAGRSGRIAGGSACCWRSPGSRLPVRPADAGRSFTGIDPPRPRVPLGGPVLAGLLRDGGGSRPGRMPAGRARCDGARAAATRRGTGNRDDGAVTIPGQAWSRRSSAATARR